MFLSVLSLFVALSQADEAPPVKAPPPAFTAKPCDIAVVSAAVAARLHCGTLKVHSPDGSVFQLAVVRKTAAEPKAGAAPVLYLHGGAGAQMTRFIGLSEDDFVPGHELIAIDLRGSGRSTPLFCPQLAANLNQLLQQSADDSSLLLQRRDALLQCQQQMLAQGFSLADFGTAQTVQDLELLREQLNIEKWHLYSISYGTVVALHYLAVAPQAITSVTLDSVYPPDELLTSFKLQQDQWLRKLDQLCRQQPGCSQRFGEMPQLFNRALARLSQSPLQIGTTPVQMLLTPDKLRLAVMAAASAEQPLSLLPLWLEAVSQGKTTLLPPWARLLSEPADLQLATVMATECADRKRFYQQNRADSLEQIFALPEGICEAFGGVAAELQTPMVPETAKVRTPVLILAGGLDLFQPDSLVLSQWLGPHSQLVAVPFALHGVRGADPCLRKMVSDFIHAPDRFGPPACLKQAAMPYLITDLEPNARLAAEYAAFSQGKPGSVLLALAALLVFGALFGLIWPLLAGCWRWLASTSQHWTKAELLSVMLICVTLSAWCGLAMVLWQGLARQSAELWLGLPVDSLPWRRGLLILTIPALAMVWWLARCQLWRPLLAQLMFLAAALVALALHLLP
ncbi:MAG: alpha/beta fold hydrolase [Rheinheimera sp.]|nr:alpha/beta fold hydrolase [Rheinheimera sp.]